MPDPNKPEEPVEPEPKAPDTEEPKEPKMVPLAEVQAVRKRAREAEAKLAEYKAKEDEAERAKMSEIERYKADLDAVTAELSTLKIGQAKRNAVDTAVKALGEGWAVDAAVVGKIVEGLQYDESTFADQVKLVVEGVKKPKMGGQSPIRGVPPAGQGSENFDPKQKLKPSEVAQLSAEQRAEYAKAQRTR